MKKYKAIFFDWDGTAVLSRRAPADEAAARMKPLLQQGVKLVIVSGTTMENLAGGSLHTYFTEEELGNLYLGLARGAYNYRYECGKPMVFAHEIPDSETLLLIHRAAYAVHEELLRSYGFPTDIVFTRPNYCKIDLMVENNRGDLLFFQENELEALKESLLSHGFQGGIRGLLDLAKEKGSSYGLSLLPTTDAKYLEAGLSSKSDNVNTILSLLKKECGILAEDCCFFGDEFIGMEAGIYGSDSFMMTEETKAGDFFDVSVAAGQRPEGVQVLGGGVDTFLRFLEEQSRM